MAAPKEYGPSKARMAQGWRTADYIGFTAILRERGAAPAANHARALAGRINVAPCIPARWERGERNPAGGFPRRVNYLLDKESPPLSRQVG